MFANSWINTTTSQPLPIKHSPKFKCDLMTNLHKLLATIGIAQLQVEYIEEISQDSEFSDRFIRELKRDANRYIKSSERLIDALSRENNIDVREQIVNLYLLISSLVEEGIDWQGSTNPKEDVG